MSKCFRCGKEIEYGMICPECAEKTRVQLLKIAIENFAKEHDLTMQELLEAVKDVAESEDE